MIGRTTRGALSVCAALTMLAGCGGVQSQLAPSAPAQPGALSPAQSRLSIAPDTRSFSPRLWYVANFYESTISAYALPSGKLKYTLTGADFPQGMRTTGSKTFWATDARGDDMQEHDYQGTSPVKTLTETVGEPAGCSIDPSTGNLAMTVLFAGRILVWTGATGSYTTLTNPLLEN